MHNSTYVSHLIVVILMALFQMNSAQKLFDLFEVTEKQQKPRNELVNAWLSIRFKL